MDLEITSILLFVVFFMPGLTVKALERFYFIKGKQRTSAYEEIFEIVVHSTIISFIGIAVIYRRFEIDLMTLSGIASQLDNVKVCGTYLILSILISVAYALLFRFVISKFLNWTRNIGREREGVDIRDVSPWEYVFMDPEYTKSHRIVSVYKGDSLLSSGQMEFHALPDNSKMDCVLKNQRFIEFILERDKAVNDKDKVLHNIWKEYVDFGSEYRIVVYDDGKYKEQCYILEQEYLKSD